ncbi:hypothetical protein WJX74_000945 [Apatococcus lobatus]|uniref:Uncharacterized protein n=1 Tax=Apatococcus lobatus TaxID=904363 RepID=A0AAW1QW73_9CHLO
MTLSQHTQAAIVAAVAVIAVLASGIGFSAKQRSTVSPFEAKLLAMPAEASPGNASTGGSPGSSGTAPGFIRGLPGSPYAPDVSSPDKVPPDGSTAPGPAPGLQFAGAGSANPGSALSPQTAASIESLQAGGPMSSANIPGSISASSNQPSPSVQPTAGFPNPPAKAPQQSLLPSLQPAVQHTTSGPQVAVSQSPQTLLGPAAAEIESDSSSGRAGPVQGPSQPHASPSSVGPMSGAEVPRSTGPVSSMRPSEPAPVPSGMSSGLPPVPSAPSSSAVSPAALAKSEDSSSPPESASGPTSAAGPELPADVAPAIPQPDAASPHSASFASAPGTLNLGGIGKQPLSAPQATTGTAQPPGALTAIENVGRTPAQQPEQSQSSSPAVMPPSPTTDTGPSDQGAGPHSQPGSDSDLISDGSPMRGIPDTGPPRMSAGQSAMVYPTPPSTLSSPPAGSQSSASIEEAPSLPNLPGQPPALAPGSLGSAVDLGSNTTSQTPPAGASIESISPSPPPPGQSAGLASAGPHAGSGQKPRWKLWWLWLVVGLAILVLLLCAACCTWMVLRRRRRRLQVACKAAGARSNAKVHALEAYAVSEREPALPFRVIRTPDTEVQSGIVPRARQAHPYPDGIAPADVAPSQVMPLNLDSAAGSTVARPMAQQLKELADSARESGPGDPELSDMPDAAVTPPTASADTAAASQCAEPAATDMTMPLVASLTDWASSESLSPPGRSDTSPAAPSATWPASAEAPVKTFVLAQHDEPRSALGISLEPQARPTSALSTFMAQHDAQLPALTPHHGDALLGGSSLSSTVVHVPPTHMGAHVAPAEHDAAGVASEPKEPTVLAKGDRLVSPVAGSGDQPHVTIASQAAAHDHARGKAVESRLDPSASVDAADEAPPGTLPENASPAHAVAAPHRELTGAAAAEPGQEPEAAMTLLEGPESRSEAPAPVAEQPAWTLLPPNPEGASPEAEQVQPSKGRLRTIWKTAYIWLTSKGGFMVHPNPQAASPQPELPV